LPACYRRLGRLGIFHEVVDATYGGTVGCPDVELRQLRELDGFRVRDEFLGPRDGLPLFDHVPQEHRVDGDGCRSVEVVMVGGPAERCANVRKFAREPGISLALPRTIPESHNVSQTPREVAGVRGAGGVASLGNY
jgi:hypothetical protein